MKVKGQVSRCLLPGERVMRTDNQESSWTDQLIRGIQPNLIVLHLLWVVHVSPIRWDRGAAQHGSGNGENTRKTQSGYTHLI